AAGSSSPSGQAAQDAIIRLDLPQNPEKYLTVRTGLDPQGQLIVEIANPTRLAVTDVTIVIRYVDPQGALRQTARTVAGRVAGGTAQRYPTGLGPFTSPDSYQVAINGARVLPD